MMQRQQQKKIYQIKLNFNRDFAPYRWMTPYMVLQQFNTACKNKYDMQIIYVKYVMSKNKQQKSHDNNFTQLDFVIDRECNNIFSPPQKDEKYTSSIQFIFNSVQRLKPPLDYIPEDEQKIRESELKKIQLKRYQNIKDKITNIMDLYLENKFKQIIQPIAISTFKIMLDHNNQFDIFIHAVMRKCVFEKMKEDSLEKNKTLIQLKFCEKIMKIYLHPSYQQNISDRVSTEYLITYWELCTSYDKHLYSYFGTGELQKKVKKRNNFINITSSISFPSQQTNQYISITTYLWNELVLKTIIKQDQIKKIQKIQKVNNYYQYYLYLKYPPSYYVCQLKKDQAISQKYLKFYDRINNFIFSNNTIINNNQFLKYFLFNNSILTLIIYFDKIGQIISNGYFNQIKCIENIQILIQKLSKNKSINIMYRQQQKKQKIKQLTKVFNYQQFQQLKGNFISKELSDKIWIIKYYILVLIKYNFIIPGINTTGYLIKYIQNIENQGIVDRVLGVLQETVRNMQSYRERKQRLIQDIRQKIQQISKSESRNPLQKQLKQSQYIGHIFRINLTPSGFLIDTPVHNLKGRVLKQFEKYSQYFMKVQFMDENECQLKNQKYIKKIYFKNQLMEIKILGRAYDPLIFQSNVRPTIFWYFHPINGRNKKSLSPIQPLDRRRIIQFLGDFRKIKNYYKKNFFISLNFTPSLTYHGKNIKIKIIPEIYNNDRVCISDGIGQISKDLLQKISQKLHLKSANVLQMSYKGIKGILVQSSQSQKNTLSIRESMLKYECYDQRIKQYLDIFNWNQYQIGYINRQIVAMMKSMGIDDQVFLELQQEDIARIANFKYEDRSAINYIQDENIMNIDNTQSHKNTIITLLQHNISLQQQRYFTELLRIIKKNNYNKLKRNGEIKIQKSLKIMGIFDQYQILDQGEIYCSVWNYYDNKAKRIVREENQVVLIRYPCLNTSDIRVVRCVGEKQIQQRFKKIGLQNKYIQLCNIVIMSQKQRYPFILQMSLNDDENNHVFISWDKRLIPKQPIPTHLTLYPQKKLQQKSNAEQDNLSSQKLLDYVIDYSSSQKQQEIQDSYIIHADKDINNYANNIQCRKLAKVRYKMLSHAVNWQISPSLFWNQYPNFMDKMYGKKYQSKSILGKLYNNANVMIQKQLQKQKLMNKLNTSNSNSLHKTLIAKLKFDYKHQQLKICIKTLTQYSKQLSNLLPVLKMRTEHEFYLKYLQNQKQQKTDIIGQIQNIKQKYYNKFFQLLSNDQQKYQSLANNIHLVSISEYFSRDVGNKIAIYYLVNYYWNGYHRDDQGDNQDEKQQNVYLCKFCKQIQNCCKQLNLIDYQLKFCGFVWFIVPKLMLYLILAAKRQQIPNSKISKEVGKENGDIDQKIKGVQQ